MNDSEETVALFVFSSERSETASFEKFWSPAQATCELWGRIYAANITYSANENGEGLYKSLYVFPVEPSITKFQAKHGCSSIHCCVRRQSCPRRNCGTTQYTFPYHQIQPPTSFGSLWVPLNLGRDHWSPAWSKRFLVSPRVDEDNREVWRHR